jgi:beta-lactamase class D
MRDFVHRFGYGNGLVVPVDGFWLTGGAMRITPRQQTEFLHRMSSFALPVRSEHVTLTWKLLEIERVGDAIFRGKTGLAAQDGRAHGWLVGIVERGERRWTYATFVRDVGPDDARIKPARKEIARALLVRSGVLPDK